MLTIISVSYKSKAFLNTNYELVKALNPEAPFQWIVVQNTPACELDEDLSMDDPRFKMIKGPTLTKHESGSSFYRSIHHAKALNLALTYTAADFILTLDPDCFILMPDWIKTIATYMQEKSLVFFGVPYHPKYDTHYRAFPNAICLFIDRRSIQEVSLDFTPDFEGTCKIIRFKIPTCRDTGYKIYARYRSRLKSEVTQIYALDHRSLKSKLFESFLPDRFRFYPRYVREIPSPLFCEIGTWGEQFFWNNELFAFHLKGVLDDVSNEEKARFKELILRKMEKYVQERL